MPVRSGSAVMGSSSLSLTRPRRYTVERIIEREDVRSLVRYWHRQTVLDEVRRWGPVRAFSQSSQGPQLLPGSSRLNYFPGAVDNSAVRRSDAGQLGGAVDSDSMP